MRFSTILGLTSLVAVNAHPHHQGSDNSQLGRRGVEVSKYTMPDLGKYTRATSDSKAQAVVRRADYVETATELVKSIYPNLEFRVVDDHYVGTNGIGHVIFKQTVHGIDIGNADFNVNVGPPIKFGQVPRLLTGAIDWT